MRLDLVALERQQGIPDRLREGNQRVRGFTGLVLFLVEDDLDTPRDRFHAIAGHPVAGRRQQIASGVA